MEDLKRVGLNLQAALFVPKEKLEESNLNISVFPAMVDFDTKKDDSVIHLCQNFKIRTLHLPSILVKPF